MLPLASGIKSNLVPRLRKKPGNEVGSKVPPRDQRQHAQFAEYGAVYMILLILVPRALLTCGATRGSGQTISELASDWLVLTQDIVFLPCFYSIRLWIWPEPLVAPRVRRALGTRMDPTLSGQDVQQDYFDVLK